ncbi:phospholipase DDHD1-like [Daktulosphaira vitifoliae]|uniref:phospholipase DDHD1-like n=1 Tax=Daktulosphaira vitifoliae TaxID=58002 RepID=UPI0021A9A416|nr:phospholipase DDHD1-like [Daktulosphaira vitifoliae]
MENNGIQIETPISLGRIENNVPNELDTLKNGDNYSSVPMHPKNIRWFYKNDSNSKRWTKFDGADSLGIENRYRANFCDEEPKVQFFVGKYTVVVRGGLYEADLRTMKCTSIFWPGEETEILRGSWFYDDYQPHEHGNEIENIHIKLLKNKHIFENNDDAKKTVIHTEEFVDANVVWYSADDIYSFSKKTHTKIMRSVTQKLGSYFQKSTGAKLNRSYKTEATDDDKLNDITHLIFMVHGIGHKTDNMKIIKNTSQFRDCVKWIKQKYFQGSQQRAEFFPVDWRSTCNFDGGLVEKITPLNLKNIRQLLNSSAMDIMYYTSPIYGQEIQNSLAQELNRLHSKFMERHPQHDIKVSIMAHSLGSVITYDIITGWEPFTLKRNYHSPKIHLNFELENLFCIGSPLSVFLALRKTKDFQDNDVFPLWLAKRVYNIYHPTDPVAYRFEPLVAKDYSRIKPVGIQAYGVKTDYSNIPIETIGDNADSPIDDTNSMDSKVPDSKRGNETFKKFGIWFSRSGNIESKTNLNLLDNGSCLSSKDSSPIESLNHRLDYILRDSIGGSASNYLSMLYTHTSYWSNYDVAYFIYTQLFPESEKILEDSPESLNMTVNFEKLSEPEQGEDVLKTNLS